MHGRAGIPAGNAEGFGRMSASSRRARIAQELEQQGSLSVSDLVALHPVSEMTIRRDLAELERQGLIRRYHGGAMVDCRRSYEPPFLVRESQNREAKARIGKAAAELAEDGDSVAVDYGTTGIAVASELAHKANLSVVTPNFRAAMELSESSGVHVIITGGHLRRDELGLVGRDAERAFENHFVDVAFLGTAGLDVDRGLTDFNADQVAVKQAIIASARKVVVVADASKIGVVAFHAVAGLDSIHALVTNADPDDPRLAAMADAGIRLHAVG